MTINEGLKSIKLMHNFDTDQIDSMIEIPASADELLPYVPLEPKAARNMFRIYILKGEKPVDAYLKTMKKLIPGE